MPAGAAADAALVPQDFVYNATADANSGVRNNRIFAQNNAGRAVTVAPAYRDMTVGGNPDPRVEVTASTPVLMPDQVNEFYVQLKYDGLTASTPIATGVEAALIRAEALGAGTGVGIINTLRARPGIALPALTPAEEADFAGTVAEERRRELWLQGTRWFDMNRLNLPQEPAAGVAYPKGGAYGNQRCWPLPDVERLANPNL
jgi:starch-binding outer membrane protein, SusD/RagB family